MAEAGAVLAGVLAFFAAVGAGWLAAWAARRAPRSEPLRTRVSVGAVARGPVQGLLASTPSVHALSWRLEGSARQVLREWMEEQGVPPAEAREAAASSRVRLPPVLVHLLEGGTYDDWWREEARARWRGPPLLFAPWYKMVEWTGSRDARCVRYLDLMTRKLEETVQPG